MPQYADDVWPARQGQKVQATVDQVTPDGSSKRLDPRQTLHDAGVRPNDTLRVSPERTAGAIDALMREEALARVRGEVLRYAESHPGFAVDANSLVAPTEYLFRFNKRGFGIPQNPDTPDSYPPVIDSHEVLVVLPPDFPIKAPEAWWQTDIFHPNIDPASGWVCLGALQEHYRPALDFGELCQMLVDLAGYRNYAIDEGHNAQAARWALSPAGQLAIEGIGGISVIGRMVMAGEPERALRIRKL
ncbi:MAG: Ubiquitin-conjugating enzyme [Candidatus Kentron sp. G]|nr:MAG: Ubiquitin-conjugating enzyme [Candidatus Kentron sp. G]VFN03651.1 MAG: Ubiquitin-conjugating enzyme [Candidatus Kentron sp. G]VFN05172.1 MAG: Ubiquitin-conjugating enzyme [Candidatus Kentron sp. G]